MHFVLCFATTKHQQKVIYLFVNVLINILTMESLTEREMCDIMSCLNQFCKTFIEPTSLYVITVWFPDSANTYLRSNTPQGQYAITEKNIGDYTNLELINKFRMLHRVNFVPIEVLKGCFGYVYALPKEAFLSKDLTKVFMVEAEDYIPTIESCYFDPNTIVNVDDDNIDMSEMDNVD